MEHNVFDKPIWVYVGLGFPSAITTVERANAFLMEVPARLRSLGYGAAINACSAAMDREIDAETARGAFMAYAKRADILVPLVDDVIAAKAVGQMSGAPA